jgi:hypothetical protein
MTFNVILECQINQLYSFLVKVLANDKEVQNAILEVERALLRQRRKVVIGAELVARFSSFEFKK